MSDVRIRRARLPDDLDQVCELYAETVEWHAEQWPDDFRMTDVRGSVREGLSNADADNGLHLLVAEVGDGRLVGLVTGLLRPQPTQAVARYDGPVMYINDLVVTGEYRRRGIGALLIEGLEQRARQHGVVAVTLQVHSQNHTAGGFYREQGFRPVQIEMRKDISDDKPSP